MKHFGRQRIDTSDNLKILMKHGVVYVTKRLTNHVIVPG